MISYGRGKSTFFGLFEPSQKAEEFMSSIHGHFVVALTLFAGILHGALADETKEPEIAGVWEVERVEFGGAAIDGLKGARLVLAADGKKTFTLPSGVVETGTYSIDTQKSPREIDSTTEGKAGTQHGIYIVEGDVLKMCLSSQGARPAEFATKQGSDLLLIILKRAVESPNDDASRSNHFTKPSGSRSFRMGFTGFIPDTTLEAVTSSRRFVRRNE